MNRKAFTLWEIVGILLVLVVVAALLFPIFARVNPTPKRHQCLSHLKQIGLGFMQYAQDYNERFPPISHGENGWADLLEPYLKSRQLFVCPNGEAAPDERRSDYFMNARLSRFAMEKLTQSASTILGGDGQDNGATNSHLIEPLISQTTDKTAPARRHLDGANYLFADGHVKWMKPDGVTLEKPKGNNYTFLPR